ncbi:unnamed protein product [Schistosoma bovis]|nr:unnamed protein product [Schistosoma bovis]CAH8646093.1 unnamed protein product [Schistosoma bovis]
MSVPAMICHLSAILTWFCRLNCSIQSNQIYSALMVILNGFSRPVNQLPRISLRTNVLNTRAHLFEVFFRRVALGYIRVFPLTARRIIEFGFLVQAVFVLVVFIHLHVTFVKSPVTCLDHLRSEFESIKSGSGVSFTSITMDANYLSKGNGSDSFLRRSWPNYGVLRIEVIRSPDPFYSLEDSYAKEFYGTETDYRFEAKNEKTPQVNELDKHIAYIPKNSKYSLAYFAENIIPEHQDFWNSLLSLPFIAYGSIKENFNHFLNYLYASNRERTFSFKENEENMSPYNAIITTRNKLSQLLPEVNRLLFDFFAGIVDFIYDIPIRIYASSGPALNTNESYIIEYALEYGFLRLSPRARNRLNVTVKLIVLDPETNPCFGSKLSRFLMEEFLGYEDLLIGSVKYLSASEGLKGYVVNVMSGQHYKLVISQMSRSSYFAAALIMLLFTFCISVLLRYSSQQLVVVIADILQMFETNTSFGIPVAPFMTVILALVAMETIMSEFFGDSITAFYVILIISVCDHYEAVFCRTELSKRYWPRYFYLYHFGFYAYHYRFNGQFSGVALWVSWLFILHSMIYFFHHYELPNLLSDWEFREFVSNNQLVGQIQLQVSTPSLSVRNSQDASSLNHSINSHERTESLGDLTTTVGDSDNLESNELSNNIFTVTSSVPTFSGISGEIEANRSDLLSNNTALADSPTTSANLNHLE